MLNRKKRMGMKKTQINVRLLAILPKVLRCTNPEIIRKTGIADSTWYRIVREPERITVQQLLSIANGMQVPVRRFFSHDGIDYVNAREDYVVSDGYRECYYDSDEMRRTIGPGTAITWKRVSETLGVHWTSVEPMMMSVRRLPVKSLLDFCRDFGFDPFKFIIDTNPPRKAGAARQTSGARRTAEGTEEVLRQMAGLREKIAGLEKKYEELSQLYKRLVNHIAVSYDIHHFSDSSIAIAAEKEKKEG